MNLDDWRTAILQELGATRIGDRTVSALVFGNETPDIVQCRSCGGTMTELRDVIVVGIGETTETKEWLRTLVAGSVYPITSHGLKYDAMFVAYRFRAIASGLSAWMARFERDKVIQKHGIVRDKDLPLPDEITFSATDVGKQLQHALQQHDDLLNEKHERLREG